MAQKDLYKILGLDKKASAEDIKKAHRKLVRQFHPDRNPGDAKAEERFKEVQAAYDILGDPDKRKQYDRGGLGAFGAGGAGRRRRASTRGRSATSSRTSSAARPAAGRGAAVAAAATGAASRAERGRDIETDVSLTFEQSVEGAQVSLQVPMAQTCGTCRGTGAKPGTSPKVCPRCQGRGVESQGQGLFSISQPCSQCHGSGTIIEDPCPTCAGRGRDEDRQEVPRRRSPRASARAAASACPARASPGAAAAGPATCSS